MKSSIVGPMAELPEEDDLLHRIKGLINEAIEDAFAQYQVENPSEIYELIENYFEAVPDATNLIRPLVIPIINFIPARLRRAVIKSLDTDHYNCRLLARDGTTELGSADIDVYPVEHLGSNALNSSPATIWPDLEATTNKYISVYYDIDETWRTPIIVDDITTCA